MLWKHRNSHYNVLINIYFLLVHGSSNKFLHHEEHSGACRLCSAKVTHSAWNTTELEIWFIHTFQEKDVSQVCLGRLTYLLTQFATKKSNRGNNHGIFHYQKLKSKQSPHLGGLRVKCAMEILYECSCIWKYEITAVCPKFEKYIIFFSTCTVVLVLRSIMSAIVPCCSQDLV